ncbi:MAG: hypothetical protein ACYC1M_03025 [Armatimonadota bacterium]
MNVTTVEYAGWKNCLRVENGEVELIITTDVGPRIIHFGFIGGANEFVVFEESKGKTGGDEWRGYGGHRLWHAPEEKPRTYSPDNSPVEWKLEDNMLHIKQPVEASTGIRKEMLISLDEKQNKVVVGHLLTNTNLWAIELAPWALSMMAPGGTCILPQEDFAPQPESLLPARPLVMWTYTNFSDPRWTLGPKYMRLRQDVTRSDPQKAGILNTKGWAGYNNGDRLFIKSFPYIADETYPDWGCNCETFTNEAMLEVESVGGTVKLQPGQTEFHPETWWLFKGFKAPESDDQLEAALQPLLEKVLG